VSERALISIDSTLYTVHARACVGYEPEVEVVDADGWIALNLLLAPLQEQLLGLGLCRVLRVERMHR
jgi:hypothetical protein